MPCQRPYRVSQTFGRNDSPIYAQLGLKGHTGWDFYAYKPGQVYIKDFPLYAPIDGVVEYIENDEKLGLGVVIRTTEEFSDKDSKDYYWKVRVWHLARNSIVVRLGQQVKVGDYLGMADNTGISSGVHCHFDLKPVDEDFNNIFQENGYFGCIDLAPYVMGLTAYEVKTSLQSIADAIQKIAAMVANLIKSRR